MIETQRRFISSQQSFFGFVLKVSLELPIERSAASYRADMHLQTTVEIDYAITSAPRDLASAIRLLSWWRDHWSIENRSHWVRDVTLGEDKCRVRIGTGPQNLAAAVRENARKLGRLLARFGIMK